MSTKLSDVIVPELFNPYVVNRTMELSALFNSGIVQNNAEFDRLASEAAPIHNMPFFEDLTGDAEPIFEDVNLTAEKITSSKDVSTTIRRAKMWAATDLAAALSGADPSKAIGDLVAKYWSRQMQKELIAILKGVFGTYTPDGGEATTPFAEHILDITTASSAAAKKASASTVIDAIQLLGDAQDTLTSMVMDSAAKSYLKKLDIVSTEKGSNNAEFDHYQGRGVIVDDSCPIETTAAGQVHTMYIFGKGAVALGNGNPVGFVPTETDRDKKKGSGVDFLINRKTFILHPRGVAWQNKVREKVETPTREELANAQNWQRVFEHKAIPMVAFKFLIG